MQAMYKALQLSHTNLYEAFDCTHDSKRALNRDPFVKLFLSINDNLMLGKAFDKSELSVQTQK